LSSASERSASSRWGRDRRSPPRSTEQRAVIGHENHIGPGPIKASMFTSPAALNAAGTCLIRDKACETTVDFAPERWLRRSCRTAQHQDHGVVGMPRSATRVTRAGIVTRRPPHRSVAGCPDRRHAFGSRGQYADAQRQRRRSAIYGGSRGMFALEVDAHRSKHGARRTQMREQRSRIRSGEIAGATVDQ